MRLAALLRRAPTTLVLALALGACTTWGRQPVPRPGQNRSLAGPVRVTRADGSTVLLDHVTITADSVVGWGSSNFSFERTYWHLAIATAEVTRVEARRADPMRTVVAVFVPVLTAVVLWASYKAGSIGTKD